MNVDLRSPVDTSLDGTELFCPIDDSPRWGNLLPTAEVSTIFRHSGWANIRQRVYDSIGRTGQTPSRLDAFARCGRDAFVMRSLTDPTRYRVGGSGCHDRFCTPCARERSQKIALNVIEQIGKTTLRFATLTVRSNHDPLCHRLTHLLRSFARIRKTALWKRCVTGGVAFLECTYSTQRRQWHPHLHCLIQGSYIPQALLSSAWTTATGDSSIVDIRCVRSKFHAARYVTKYAVKPLTGIPTNEPDLLDEAVTAMRGRRLCTTFGTWRGLLLTVKETFDAWVLIETFASLVARAKSGEADARTILNRLAPQISDDLLAACTDARAPPHTDLPQHHQTLMPSITKYTTLAWATVA